MPPPDATRGRRSGDVLPLPVQLVCCGWGAAGVAAGRRGRVRGPTGPKKWPCVLAASRAAAGRRWVPLAPHRATGPHYHRAEPGPYLGAGDGQPTQRADTARLWRPYQRDPTDHYGRATTLLL